ncbi:MAG: DUF6048 family protein [Cyclobacteriaceae bacterium]
MRKCLVFTFLIFQGLWLLAQEGSPFVQTEDSIARPDPILAQPELENSPEDTATLGPVRALVPSIYIDYGKLLALPLDTEAKYEGGVEFLIKGKVPIILEVGMATLTPGKAYANGTYEAEGVYYRFGTGIYSQWKPKNKLGITFKYAVSSFDETAILDTENTINIPRTLSASYQRTDISASWIEFAVYTDRTIYKFLAIGMNIRFRYLLDYDLQTPDDVYAIPGYGRSFDQSIPAVNLFLKVSF